MMSSRIERICWLHGWGMSPRLWGDLPSSLPEVQHSFIDYSACVTAEDFRNVLPKHLVELSGAGRIALVGWSMGGMLALEEMFREREQLAFVVLLGSTLKFISEDKSQGWPKRMVERLSRQVCRNPGPTLQEFALNMLGETEKMTVTNTQLVDNIQETDWIGQTDFTLTGLEAGLTYLCETDLRIPWNAWRQHAAGMNRTGLLWIHGKEDLICPLGCVPELEAGENMIVERMGHAPMLTRLQLLKEQLRSFLYGH